MAKDETEAVEQLREPGRTSSGQTLKVQTKWSLALGVPVLCSKIALRS